MRIKILFVILLIILGVKSIEANEEDAFTPQAIARQYREEGYLAQKKGDTETARAFYEKAAAIDPSFAPVYNDLGVIYEAEGAFDKAESNYLRAIELDPAYLPPYANMALLCEKEERWEEAKYFWKQRYLRDPRPTYWRKIAEEHIMLLGGDEEVRESQLREEAQELMVSLTGEDNSNGDNFERTIHNYFHGGFHSVGNN